MHLRPMLNAAAVGSQDGAVITALHRSQWLGLEGAPETSALSFNMPLLYNRIGVGANLRFHRIGITEQWTFDGMYAYRVPVGRGTVSVGIQASLRYYGINFNDERLVATQGISTDDAIPIGRQSRYLPNFGAGFYYKDPHFYFGLSAPRVIKSDLEFSEVGLNENNEVRHGYLMAGFDIPLKEELALRPNLLVKFAERSPFDIEANLSAIYLGKYGIGVGYRLGNGSNININESVNVMASVQLSDNMLVGLAYDLTLSALKDYNDGSAEILVQYHFAKAEGKEFISPRFF